MVRAKYEPFLLLDTEYPPWMVYVSSTENIPTATREQCGRGRREDRRDALFRKMPVPSPRRLQ